MTTKTTRRCILRGVGGMALALPFLPSLAPRPARAGGLVQPRRLVAIRTGHWGCWESNFFPEVPAGDTMNYAGHGIRRSDLTGASVGGDVVLSSVLRAPETLLTPEIVSKLNVIRGVDSMHHVGHNAGAFLGNPHATLDEETRAALTPRPTIDQLLAWSPWFYDDLSTTL